MSYSGEPQAGALSDAGIPPGTVIAGKYVVERILGKGGMGVVVAALHRELREPVALKFLHGEMAKRPSLVARFQREARAAVRIKSEHVARVIDVGIHEGSPFIVMELLAGIDFHKLSSTRGPLPCSEAALYVAQACDAVAEAHLYGIVHRDLKPANLFLTRRADGSPLVKVLDFGISKMADEADENLTQTTDVLGSPLYMSPEQIECPRDVDARTDVWSLGAILYKLLTGKAAFAAETASASLAKIVTKPPPPLRALRPDVPSEIEAIILHCLEKDANKRLQTVADLGRALQPFTGVGVAEGTASGASYSQPAARPEARSRRPATLVAVGLSTLLGAGLALWMVGSRGTPARGAGTERATLSAATSPSPTPSPSPAPAASTEPSPAASVPSPVTTSSAAVSPSARPARPSTVGEPPRWQGKAPSRGAPSDAFSDRL
jgi:serine/threonine-protein kinase